MKGKSKHALNPCQHIEMYNLILLHKIGIKISFTYQRFTLHVNICTTTKNHLCQINPLILYTCPKMTASNKEPCFLVMKKRTRTYKLIALPHQPPPSY